MLYTVVDFLGVLFLLCLKTTVKVCQGFCLEWYWKSIPECEWKFIAGIYCGQLRE